MPGERMALSDGGDHRFAIDRNRIGPTPQRMRRHQRYIQRPFRQAFVDKIGGYLGRGVKAEDVIDRRSKFKPTFIAVPFDAFDPLWINDTGTIDPQGLFFQVANLGRIRA